MTEITASLPRPESISSGADGVEQAFSGTDEGDLQTIYESHLKDLYLATQVAATFLRDNAGKHLSQGAIYGSLAAICAQMGDVDRAAVYYFRATHEDMASHKEGEPPIANLWGELVRNPELDFGAALLAAVEPEATSPFFDEAVRALGLNEFAFLASLHSLRRHIGFLEEFSAVEKLYNTFSHLQIISGFRNLTALLELRLREVIGSTAMFYDLLQAGYQKNLAVWARFEAEKKNCGMSSKSTISYATRLRYVLSPFSAPSSHKERFAQSLLVTYIVRNYSAHDMDLDGPLVEPAQARTILGHILHVFTYCELETNRG